MFIELTSVYYDNNVRNYKTGKLFIKVSDIVSVTDKDDHIGTYWCRRIQLSSGKTYYVKESYKYIVDKMSALINLMYKCKEDEDNDWK